MTNQKAIGPGFHGELTTENLEEVANALEQFLRGKFYTFIQHNPIWDNPYIQRKQFLTASATNPQKAITTFYHDFGGGLLTACDSYGVWQVSTGAKIEFKENEVVINFTAANNKLVTYQIVIE